MKLLSENKIGNYDFKDKIFLSFPDLYKRFQQTIYNIKKGIRSWVDTNQYSGIM